MHTAHTSVQLLPRGHEPSGLVTEVCVVSLQKELSLGPNCLKQDPTLVKLSGAVPKALLGGTNGELHAEASQKQVKAN